MNKPKPKKEIKPGRGWVDPAVKIRASQTWEWKSQTWLIPVTILPTRDYRRLLADAKAYRELMEGK